MERTNGKFGTTFVKITGNREQTTERFLPQLGQIIVTYNENNEPQQYVFNTYALGGTPSESSLTIVLRKDNEDCSIRAWLGNHTYLDFTDISMKEYKVLEQKMWELGNPHVEYDLDGLMNTLRDSKRPEYTEILTRYDKTIATKSAPPQKILKD